MECAKNLLMGRKLKQANEKKKQSIEGNYWPQSERVGWDETHTDSSVCVCFNSVWACDLFIYFCACENRGFVFPQGRFIIFPVKLLLMVSLNFLLVQLKRPHHSCHAKIFQIFKHFQKSIFYFCSVDTITCHLKSESPKNAQNRWHRQQRESCVQFARQVCFRSIYHCVQFVRGVYPGWLLPLLGVVVLLRTKCNL